MKFTSPYLHRNYLPMSYRPMIDEMVVAIKKLQKKLKFEAIAVTGSSGLSVAFTISYLTSIPVIHVRKEPDHHGNEIEGCDKISVNKYLIVDDCIDSGDTVDKIVEKIKQRDKKVKCVGIMLYRYGATPGESHNGLKIYKVGTAAAK